MKQAIVDFLEYLKLANKSAQTIRQYRGVLLDFQKLIGEIPQAQLDIPHIEAYLEALPNGNCQRFRSRVLWLSSRVSANG